MIRILVAVMAVLLLCGAVFGQGTPDNAVKRVGDTTISKANNFRVPVYLKVGKRPDDPFPTYKKAFLSADSVGVDSHYVVMSGWLSVPIPTTTLQHAIAGEIYYTAESDTMKNNLVGQELSVNVPGRLVFDRTTGHYGIYGLIVNGKPTTTNGNGYIEGNRFVGIYIDLADVSAGQVDSVRVDTTIGLWIPSLDGGTTDSGYVKLGIWSKNNIRTDDSMLVADRIIMGTGTSDSAWFGADTISGITHWTTKGAVVPVINTRSNTSETGMLQLLGDSAQIRILHTVGATFMQFGDSAFTASDSVYLTGYSSNNLHKLEIRANKLDIRTAGNYTFRMPVTAPSGTGQVLAIATAPTPDSTYWVANGGGLDSTTAEGYFVNQNGDTVYGDIVFDTTNGGGIKGVSRVLLSGNGFNPTVSTDAADNNSGTFALRLQYGSIGGLGIYTGTTERQRAIYDSVSGLGRSDLTAWIRGYIDSLIADRLYARTAAVDTMTGRDTGVPTMGDPMDFNGYNAYNIDTAQGNIADFDTYLNIVADSPFVFNITTSATGTEYATTTRRIKARPGANVTISREDSTSFNLMRIAVPDDSIWAVVEDSLDNMQYVYLQFQAESWDRPLADSIFILGRHRIFKDTDSSRAMLCMDSASAITEPKSDTLYFSVAMPYAGSIDTVGLVYDCSSANNYITAISLLGPDRENGLNGCDSTYQTWTDDRDNTSFVYLPLDNTDKTVQNGDIWGLRIIFTHAADNGQVRIGWIRFAYRRTS